MPTTVEVHQNVFLPVLGILLIIAVVAFLVWWFVFRVPPPPTGMAMTDTMNVWHPGHSSMGSTPGSMGAMGSQAQYAVNIQNFAFVPMTLTVPRMATVTWTNNDSANHTVTQDNGGGSDSGIIRQGQTYSKTFDTVGEFHYHCSLHPNMKGTIITI